MSCDMSWRYVLTMHSGDTVRLPVQTAKTKASRGRAGAIPIIADFDRTVARAAIKPRRR